MAPVKDYDTTGIETCSIPSFTFVSGAALPINVCYRRFNTSATRTVLIPTCFGGRINTTLNFTKGSLSQYHVVVVAMLGNGESSSPSNTTDFPSALDYRDQIAAQYHLLNVHLGMNELEAVIGFSMGGQQAYYWALSYPELVQRAVVICSSARTSDHNYAFLEGPRAALLNSSGYAGGGWRQKGISPADGVKAFGRAYVAWAFSQPWFRAKEWKKLSGTTTMKDFMNTVGDGLFEGWDADDLLALSAQWQRGDIGVFDRNGDFRQALESIKCKVLLMPSRTDQYFPPEDSEIEVSSLKQGKLVVIESIWGHVAGGGLNPSDSDFMDQQIADFLA